MRLTATRLRRAGSELLLAFAASFSPIASAGPGRWTTGGPDGGGVETLAIGPATSRTLYSGTYGGGVLASTDAGGTWVVANTGLADLRVHVLALSPATPATLYAGTESGGVFRSADAGGTWAAANAGLPSPCQVHALAVDPSSPATIYAGTWGRKIFRSTDAGGTWVAASTGLTKSSVYALAIDPSNPATLFAGTWGGGVFKSTDAGGTWTASSTGLKGLIVLALAVDPVTPATLYAGTADGGVFRSTDSGASWTAASTGMTTLMVFALAADPTTPATLYAGTGDGGVFRSTDSGGTWAAASAGLTDLPVRALAIDPSTPSRLYAGTGGDGVFLSADSGGTWAAANTGLTSHQVYALAIDPAAPATLCAGVFAGGVFKSTDAGGAWVAVNTGLTSRRVVTLALDPANPATLYAGTDGGGLFRSTDGGQTWASASKGLTNRLVYALAIGPTTPSTVYAGTMGGGVFRSTDAGSTWTAASTGLTSLYVHALVVDPETPATLYAATMALDGVFRSTDSGRTWAAAGTGLPLRYDVHVLAIDPAAPATVYAGTEGSGVFASTDSGATWAATGRGLANLTVRALAVHPTARETLYAGTDAGGLFRSTDAGGTWAPAGNGLPLSAVTALALDPTGATTVHAGLEGGSVWHASPPPVTSPASALLPSSARAPGAGGAFYTTDLTIANAGGATTAVVKFLGNNADGRGGLERSFWIAAGAAVTLPDVLGSLFGKTTDYGAIRVTSPSDSLRVLSQTSTLGFGGTFGQSVPAARPEDLIAGGTPRSILAVREDASFRTNLILANASEAPLDVGVTLVADSGTVLGASPPFSRTTPLASRSFTLPPLGMTQVSRVVRELGVTTDVAGARLVVSTPSSGSFAAYAAVIDNVTNDPRTLLPLGPVVSGRPSPDHWILPSSARASGAGGAFYTTDLTVATTSSVSARYTLKLLGNNADGRSGPETTFDLGPGKSATYTDVLGSVFQRTSDYGAIRVTSQSPASDSTFLAVLSQTSTPGFGGTFGQSVPAATATDLIRAGIERSILAVREDDSFRTNLILANATEAALDVDVRLVSAEGTVLATKRYPLPPLGMTQVTKVVRDLGIATNIGGARLVISTPNPGGAFAAYASVIDNVTNDPRTLLPR